MFFFQGNSCDNNASSSHLNIIEGISAANWSLYFSTKALTSRVSIAVTKSIQGLAVGNDELIVFDKATARIRHLVDLSILPVD